MTETGGGTSRSVVAIVATVDTKAAEVAYLRAELEARHCAVRVVDVGLRGSSAQLREADVAADVVASAGGGELGQLRERARRDHAIATMGAGAAAILQSWCVRGEVHGVLGVGGNQGTAIAAAAMRELPFGLPKYIVSHRRVGQRAWLRGRQRHRPRVLGRRPARRTQCRDRDDPPPGSGGGRRHRRRRPRPA